MSFVERENTSPTGAYLPFLQKIVESASRGKSAGVSGLKKMKNKELLAASGQDSVLAAEVKQLGNCLHLGVNLPELSVAFLVPDKPFMWFIFAQLAVALNLWRNW